MEQKDIKKDISYKEQLEQLIGRLENGEEPENYGLTYNEYANPDAETIKRVKDFLEMKKKNKMNY